MVLGLVVAICLYWLYKFLLRAKWCKPGGGGGMEKGRPTPPPSASVDMTYSQGQVTSPKQMAVYGGGDARNAYWQLKEDRCMDCIESSRLEKAWRLGERRRSKERFAQEAQGEGHPRGAGGGEQAWRRQGSPSPVKRALSVESF